jgi:hypothetical protein
MKKQVLHQLINKILKYILDSTIYIYIHIYIYTYIYIGIVVAKLPFEPISLFRNITHRSINIYIYIYICISNILDLLGNDPTDCAYIFIYILFSFIVRGNIQKFFGILIC